MTTEKRKNKIVIVGENFDDDKYVETSSKKDEFLGKYGTVVKLESMPLHELMEKTAQSDDYEFWVFTDRRYGVSRETLASLRGIKDLKLFTKVWQLSGIKPAVRQGAINLENSLSDREKLALSRLPLNFMYSMKATLIFYVAPSQRVYVISERELPYDLFVRDIFNAYSKGYSYITSYCPVGYGLAHSCGLIGDLFNAGHSKMLVVDVCDNLAAKDVQNGPPLFLYLNSMSKKAMTGSSNTYGNGRRRVKSRLGRPRYNVRLEAKTTSDAET